MDFIEASVKVKAVIDPSDPSGSAARVSALFDADPELFEAYRIGEIGNPVTIRQGVDPMQMTADYMTGVQGAQAKYVRGIQAPRRNPQQAAVAAAGKYNNAMTQVIQQNRYQKGAQSYNLDDAIQTAVADNGAAYVAGAQKRQAKVQRAFALVAQDVTAVSAAVHAMPQDTLQQRIARSAAMQQGMADRKSQRMGGGTARP